VQRVPLIVLVVPVAPTKMLFANTIVGCSWLAEHAWLVSTNVLNETSMLVAPVRFERLRFPPTNSEFVIRAEIVPPIVFTPSWSSERSI
jgi:hypothetical protein